MIVDNDEFGGHNKSTVSFVGDKLTYNITRRATAATVNETVVGYTKLDIDNLASGHVVVIFTVVISMLTYMFLVDRWRALRQKKKNKSLKTNRKMEVRTNKHFPTSMLTAISKRYENTLQQREIFNQSIPIGAEQRGWGAAHLSKQPRWKKKVADTAIALDKIFARDSMCDPRGQTESIVDFGQKLARMERYRELASVIKGYVDKYEIAKFSPLEMGEDDLDQAHSYLQQMLGSVQNKLKMEIAYGRDPDMDIHGQFGGMHGWDTSTTGEGHDRIRRRDFVERNRTFSAGEDTLRNLAREAESAPRALHHRNPGGSAEGSTYDLGPVRAGVGPERRASHRGSNGAGVGGGDWNEVRRDNYDHVEVNVIPEPSNWGAVDIGQMGDRV